MRTALIQEMFQQSVARFGARTAIEWPQGQLTYRELDDRSNCVANFLIDRGASRGSIIAVAVGETASAIAAILAILKIGGAYVPLDMSLPDPRLEIMLEQARPEFVVTDLQFLTRIDAIYGRLGLMGRAVISDESADICETKQLLAFSNHAPEPNRSPVIVEHDPDQIAYVYFTSGSTGKPKGIAGRLKGIDHFIRWEIETLGLTEGVRASQLMPLTFDGSVRDIFAPLCAGGTICVPESRETILDTTRLVEWLDRKEISLIHCVPSLFRAIINTGLRTEQLQALKHVVMAGEPVLPTDVARWTKVFGERIQLVNLYGTSETTLAKFFYFIRESDKDRLSIPIGRPMPGARSLVLDEKGRVCPPGTVGEIYIRTPYRSLGYINQPELTAESFVKNPLSDDPQDIVYKTGDLGRILEDGNFEYVGRRDQQVKIRGMRVELSEIESLLLEHHAVRDVAVIDRADREGNKFLCAFVVSDEVGDDELRELIASRLPDFMIPSTFMFMEKLPRTLSGKVDRKALPSFQQVNEGREFVPPRTSVEEVISEVWAEVLGLKRVGVADNFFQLGGHSLLATQVISRIREALQVEVPISAIFEGTTVEKLALLVEEREAVPGQAEKIARIWKRVHSMSVEDARSMLREKEAIR